MRNLVHAIGPIVALLCCCGTPKMLVLYDGPRQAREQVAVVDISHGGVIVTRIDSVGKKHFALHGGYAELLPGRHTIEANFRSDKGSSDSPVVIEFEAQAGTAYQVQADAGFRQWETWIVDTASGKRVSEKRKGTLSPPTAGPYAH